MNPLSYIVKMAFCVIALVWGLLVTCGLIAILVFTLIGLWAGFAASLLLGLIVLIVEPVPLILGICVTFGNNWAPAVAEFLKLPF